jgi:hypothetical protein
MVCLIYMEYIKSRVSTPLDVTVSSSLNKGVLSKVY